MPSKMSGGNLSIKHGAVFLSIALSLIFSIVPESAFLNPAKAAPARLQIEPVSVMQVPPTIAWGRTIEDPQAVIVCVHGLGLHKGTFEDFGKTMAARGIPVYALDVRGFGDWHMQGKDELNLIATLSDIKTVLENVKERHPKSQIFLLGESMGGAIALRATAMYPDLVAGLISSVPSGDRFSGLGEDLNIGLHVLAGGFSGRFDVGSQVIKHASKKNQDLRDRWGKDPASRAQFSPDELIAFQNFMNKNNETAAQVKKTPVLILQGAQDKLVRPAGSSFVWDHLSTPDRKFAVSKSAEHLIFEYGQFKPEDIKFVEDWIKTAMAPLPSQTLSEVQASDAPKVQSKDEIVASAPRLSDFDNKSSQNTPDHSLVHVSSGDGLPSLKYWIELMRDGKRYRCNNKTSFKTGDEIRLHLICSLDGYAYILMKQGTSGAHAVLFPESRTGRNNAITALKDYALPSASWLKFDEKPGTEKICLIFAKTPLDPDTNKYMNLKQSVLVSADRSGSKDLCPTRMQISWDDPNPLIIPASSSDVVPAVNSSMIMVSQKEANGSLLSVDIDLEHKQ